MSYLNYVNFAAQQLVGRETFQLRAYNAVARMTYTILWMLLLGAKMVGIFYVTDGFSIAVPYIVILIVLAFAGQYLLTGPLLCWIFDKTYRNWR